MPGELISLRDERERTITLLTDRFAHDDLEMDEFERRLTLAHRAATLVELRELVADLVPGGTGDAAPELQALARPQPVAAGSVRPQQNITAILSGVQRRGPWTCARELKVVAILGGVELDFREARFAPGTTEVHIAAVLGGVKITVPPDLAVEMEGTGIMGGFAIVDRSPPEPDPDRPLLRIRGTAILGGVEVTTRLPGERGREARLRRKQERRALREARKTRKELPPHRE